MKNDWYEALHPGQRAKAEKAAEKPVAKKLADWFAAEYGDQVADLQAAA